jgi:hypoxanthine phosphoribosyltransferase
MNPQLKTYIPSATIRNKVKILADRISNDYKDKDLLLIGVLNGSFVFLADLIREIQIPIQVDTIAASSYGNQTFSSGKVELTKKLSVDPKGKFVILVEDIIETGLTLQSITEYMQSLEVQSVKICSLLVKRKEGSKTIDFADYIGFEIEDRFVVGYGLDYAGLYRNLPYIAELKFI